MNPDDADSWAWLGDSYNKIEKFDNAANAYANALEIEPNNKEYKKQFKLNKKKIR